MRLTSWLFRAARAGADGDALASGKPDKIARRAKNKAAGRLLGRAGFWRWLWK